MRSLIGIGLLSAAVLLLQVALTRVFSIAQFYHFAVLVVSLALLGFGASGSLLALFPRLRDARFSAGYALGFSMTTLAAYLFINHEPFDSYSIAWDRKQVYLLIGNLLGLAVPFVFVGAVIGLLLSHDAEHAGKIYGANLVGSALGSIAAPILIALLGSERVVILCALLGAGSGLVLLPEAKQAMTRLSFYGAGASVLLLCLFLLISFPDGFEIQPSPYKLLSQFRLNPDAKFIETRQNAYSRLDIIQSPTIHSAQGLSVLYFGELPPQAGLLIDGDNLLPVPDTSRAPEKLGQSLPAAVAYTIRPDADTLILGAGGGMDAWAAKVNGAKNITVIEPNRLVYEALTDDLREWYGLDIQFKQEEIRSYAQKTDTNYDMVLLSLTDGYRPITSGAFTLTENYTLTVEAFESYLALCGDDGLLVLNRWLQTPPSETLRTLALILSALGDRDPMQQVVAFRSFQLMTFIVKPTPFTAQETDALLQAIDALHYDLVLAPEMPPEMINQYARLENDDYHEFFIALVEDRDTFYKEYAFRITPPTDDQPFFFHFFRWSQTPDILQNLGRTWQPFGGSGYFVLLALLGFALAAAFGFVMLPIVLRRRFRRAFYHYGAAQSARTLGYFTAIGLAFLLVEVALIQRYMLVLGQPTLAIAVIIGSLLFFSGLGSPLSHRFPWRATMIVLAILIAATPLVTDLLKPLLLVLPPLLRIAAAALLTAPLGFLMGIPFARGITALKDAPDLIPWAWAVNGSASVISAVLAAALALSLGFTLVLMIGGGLYLTAALLVAGEGDKHHV